MSKNCECWQNLYISFLQIVFFGVFTNKCTQINILWLDWSDVWTSKLILTTDHCWFCPNQHQLKAKDQYQSWLFEVWSNLRKSFMIESLRNHCHNGSKYICYLLGECSWNLSTAQWNFKKVLPPHNLFVSVFTHFGKVVFTVSQMLQCVDILPQWHFYWLNICCSELQSSCWSLQSFVSTWSSAFIHQPIEWYWGTRWWCSMSFHFTAHAQSCRLISVIIYQLRLRSGGVNIQILRRMEQCMTSNVLEWLHQELQRQRASFLQRCVGPWAWRCLYNSQAYCHTDVIDSSTPKNSSMAFTGIWATIQVTKTQWLEQSHLSTVAWTQWLMHKQVDVQNIIFNWYIYVLFIT